MDIIIKDTAITLVLATRLSVLEVLHNICDMGTHDLPDMYACSPWALGIHIRQITHYNYKLWHLDGFVLHNMRTVIDSLYSYKQSSKGAKTLKQTLHGDNTNYGNS